MDIVKVRGISKSFGKLVAVDNVDFDVKEGEILTLLGPSGCGKTTTLRIIAGLEKPDNGEVHLGDKLLCSGEKRVFIPPNKRDMGMVFQSYAVWPHMTVFENVAFPLKLRRVPKAIIKEKVRQILELADLRDLEGRGATLLSGGQQQRVALARALIFSPKILLLDEPLSNLDAKLRAQMRLELKALQQRIGVTTIFVTHDQLEAMVISDRLAVMNQGKIEQMGSPLEIYEKPRAKFVVDFIGLVNYISGKVVEVTPERCLVQPTRVEGEPLHCVATDNVSQGEEVILSVRPEGITVYSSHPGQRLNLLPSKVKVISNLGDRIHYVLGIGEESLDVFTPPSQRFSQGETLFIELNPQALFTWRA